jgi:hypothetical protein
MGFAPGRKRPCRLAILGAYTRTRFDVECLLFFNGISANRLEHDRENRVISGSRVFWGPGLLTVWKKGLDRRPPLSLIFSIKISLTFQQAFLSQVSVFPRFPRNEKCAYYRIPVKKANSPGGEDQDEAPGAAHFGATAVGGPGRGRLPRQGHALPSLPFSQDLRYFLPPTSWLGPE